MSDKTQANPLADAAKTELNSAFGNATVINPVVSAPNGQLAVGTVLSEKYEVVRRLDVSTGEADIYICTYQNKNYVAKVYRRPKAIKQSILDALKSIRSPFIARTFDVGTYQGLPYEVLPYYEAGSLQGHRYTFEELKTTIIPDINEALHVLHQHNIIHKDVKPSNIMQWNDRSGVALIDFGISSVMEDGNTMIVTSTGMTPEYSAPETFRGLFLDESDYYSFGITLYELFCGSTPYKNMTADQIAQYTAVQKIPFPATMPKELQDLITGLTYVDITHRNESNNPNKRWTYDEVLKWCMGKKQAIPGAVSTATVTMPAYTFMGQKYTDTGSLVEALAGNWTNGKRQLFRGLMSGFFKSFNPEVAGYCMDAEEAANESGANDDVIFWKLLYQMEPSLRTFLWKSYRYESLAELGDEILANLRTENGINIGFWTELLQCELLSYFVDKVCGGNIEVVNAIKAIETAHKHLNNNKRTEKLNFYTLGYLLSGDRTYRMGQNKFSSVDDLTLHMKQLLDCSFDEFAAFCNRVIGKDGNLDPQFEAWLIALGNRKELESWKRKTSGH